MTDPALVQAWLVRLFALIGERGSPQEATRRIDTLTPFVAEAFPPGAFCQRSLEHVAARCKFWPSYAEVREALTEWRRQFLHEPRTALPAPQEPPRGGPGDDEIAAVRALVQQATSEMRAMALARDAAEREGRPPLRPLRDVTAKGEHLRQIRERTGLVVPERPA